MSVLLTDRQLGVRRATTATDGHGSTYPTGWGTLAGPWPGRAAEGPDVPAGQTAGRTWVLAVDPAGWPLDQGDLVVELQQGATVAEWLVTSADILTNNADPSVDYIRVEAHLRTTGTRP